MSNGKMMVLCFRNNIVFSFDRSLKWVLAENSDFSYNFEKAKYQQMIRRKLELKNLRNWLITCKTCYPAKNNWKWSISKPAFFFRKQNSNIYSA
jgi:hypothetical protein